MMVVLLEKLHRNHNLQQLFICQARSKKCYSYYFLESGNIYSLLLISSLPLSGVRSCTILALKLNLEIEKLLNLYVPRQTLEGVEGTDKTAEGRIVSLYS